METAEGLAGEPGRGYAGKCHGSKITYEPRKMSFALVFSI